MKGFSRREFLKASGSAIALPLSTSLTLKGCSFDQEMLTIAYGANLSSWDPTTGLSSLNPQIQSLYKAVFDSFIGQSPDRSLRPGILIDWGWNDDRSKIQMTVRRDAFWHDGLPVTADDVVWSLERAGNSVNGNPMHFIWSKITNFSVSGNTVTADVSEYDPTIFKWMVHLTGYILPKHAYTALGADAWEQTPIGSGPYIVDKYEQNNSVLLRAFPQYWGPKPQFETVLIKMIPDAQARVEALEAGKCDLAVGLSFSEFNRVTSKTSWTGNAYPVTDVGLIFLTNKDALMKDRNIRLAMHHAIDKQKLIDELMLGYGRPMDSLQVPGYDAYDPSVGFGRPMDSFQVPLFDAYDPSIKTDFDPYRARNYLSKSGYSKSKPVKLTIQTTQGYRPKDYEMVKMITEMWQEVGIEANIQIHADKEHLRLRARHELAPAAFFNWSNSTGDPFMSTGLAMLSNSPDSTFKSAELDRLIMPLMNEADERKRIRGYQKIDRYIADEGLIIPLVQFFQTVAHSRDIEFTPQSSGEVLPQEIRSR